MKNKKKKKEVTIESLGFIMIAKPKKPSFSKKMIERLFKDDSDEQKNKKRNC